MPKLKIILGSLEALGALGVVNFAFCILHSLSRPQ